MHHNILQINGLIKRFGTKTAVNVNSLEITEGECVGLLGNNGAGKTTLFRMILDLLLPEEGKVHLFGEPVKGNDSWKQHTGAFLDEDFLVDYLSAEEFFNLTADLKKVPRAELKNLLEELSDFHNGEILNQKKYIRDFSKGNQKKIGITAALIGKPKWLMLDEPFTNLDPGSQLALRKLLKQENANGTTMFISSHDLNHVVEVCKRIVIVKSGEVVTDMPTDQTNLNELYQLFENNKS